MTTLRIALGLALCAGTVLGADVFFSEYGEGSGDGNKYVEIYNGTGGSIDVTDYRVTVSKDGTNGLTRAYTNATGTVAAGDVYVICDNLADADIIAEADYIDTNVDFSGNDAVVLWKHDGSDWVEIDTVGLRGEDPGTAWDVAGVNNATKDYTLLRKSSVTTGNTNWPSSAGSDSDDSEWIVREQDYWGNVGDFGPTPPELTLDPAVTERTLALGNSVSYTIVGTDLDGDSVTLSALNVPLDAAWSNVTAVAPVTNTFAWTPGAVTNVTITFVATDADGSVSNDVTIVVEASKTTELLISELCDPENYFVDNRYIEIYNPSTRAKSLDGWTVVAVANGSESDTWVLGGSIASGEALVCGDINISNTLADFTVDWGNNTWNGDDTDGARLYEGSTLVDDAVGLSFANSVMTRKPDVIGPTPVFVAEQWVVEACDDIDVAPSTPGVHSNDYPAALLNMPTLLIVR